MRDIAIAVALFGVLPFILRRPWIGIIAWVVVSVMNPHRLAYGFSYSLPVAMLIAGATVAGALLTKDQRRFPVTAVTVTLGLLVLWMNITTLFALYPGEAFPQYIKVMKIMFMVFLGLALLHSRPHLNALVWAIVISLGFYGVKGGIFALMTGGAFKVYGPPESEVADNNAISFALVMVFPLMYYLTTASPNKWIRRGLIAAMAVCTFAILASHSRGAFLAIIAMAMMLWLKSDRKSLLGLILIVLAPVAISFMPDEWMARMQSISSYEQDASSIGRINTWWMAFNLSKDFPITGGGFQIYNDISFMKWAPDPSDIHAAHSIYFAALGEHGYIGLALFLLLSVYAWRTGTFVSTRAATNPDLRWAATLGRMLQVSMVGYLVGGAFLSVLYFDVYYYILSALVLLRVVVEKDTQGGRSHVLRRVVAQARAHAPEDKLAATSAQRPIAKPR